MLITLSRRTVICQSVAEVQLTGVAPLGAVSHRFIFLNLYISAILQFYYIYIYIYICVCVCVCVCVFVCLFVCLFVCFEEYSLLNML